LTEGVAEIGFDCHEGATQLIHLYQRDPLRVLFRTSARKEPPIAALLTTSGGLVAGDQARCRRFAPQRERQFMSSHRAEKVYRSLL